MKRLSLDPRHHQAPTRDHASFPDHLPDAKETKLAPTNAGGENASLYFIGTATTVLYVQSRIPNHGFTESLLENGKDFVSSQIPTFYTQGTTSTLVLA